MESCRARVTDWSVSVLYSAESQEERTKRTSRPTVNPQNTPRRNCVSPKTGMWERGYRENDWKPELGAAGHPDPLRPGLHNQGTGLPSPQQKPGEAWLWALDWMTPSTGVNRCLTDSLVLYSGASSPLFLLAPKIPPALPHKRSDITALSEVHHSMCPSTHTGIRSAFRTSLLNVNGYLRKASHLKKRDDFSSSLK